MYINANPVSPAKIIFTICLTFFVLLFFCPLLGAGAAEVEAGAAAEREEGEEGNTCSQFLSQQFVSVLYGK